MTVFLLAGFLKALKIILIILACLILFVLFVLFLLLFVPFRYQGRGFYKEEHPEHEDAIKTYDFYVKLSWLLHFVSACFSLNQDLLLKVKVLGIKVYSKNFNRESGEAENTETEAETEAEVEPELEAEPAADLEAEDNIKGTDSDTETDEDNKESSDETEKSDTGNASIASKIKRLKDLTNKKSFKNACSLCKDELIKLLKHVLPRKWEITGYVGFDDPYKTGEMLAFLGSIYGLIYRHVDIKGNFNSEEKDVKIYFKGRITLFTVLMIGIKIYFNKNIRKVIDEIREVL